MRAVRWIALLGVAAVCAAGLLLLRRGEMVAGGHVIGRLGAEGAQVEPAQAAARVRLGRATRLAIQVKGNAAFEATFVAPPRHLVFSIGAKGIGETGCRAQFSIQMLDGDTWKPLFSKNLREDPAQWADYTLSLETAVPAPRRLRFETEYTAPPGSEPAVLYWGSVLAFGRSGEVKVPSPPLNVILVSLDTLGAEYLSSFGNAPQVSPVIDAFMDEGFSFRHAYAQYPNTPVSHASLFTGLYPKHHGVYETSPWMHPQDTLAGTLARHGYFTAAITENAFLSSDFGFDAGFDWYDNGKEKTTNPDDWGSGNANGTFGAARRWLEQYGEAPFFLFIHTYEVHVPYVPKDARAREVAAALNPGYAGPFQDYYAGSFYELGHNRGREYVKGKDLRQMEALYSAEIEYLDRVVGDFAAYLASRPDAERTLVVLTSDHGDEFGVHGKLGHGETLHGEVLHVPLAFHQTGRVKKGRTDMPVELIDVMPTILELAQIPAPGPVDGRTLVPLLRGMPPEVEGRAFAELKTARGDCLKLGLEESCNVNRLAVQTEGYRFITSEIPPFEHLYDLQADPREMRDISAEAPRLVERYRALLHDYRSDAVVGQSGPRVPTAGLDPETVERLRALGYID